MLLREAGNLLHVDSVVVGADAIGDRLEPAAGEIDRRAVRQMAARGEIKAEEGVARLQQREEHRLVGLAARIRLHIGELAIEESGDALDRQRLNDIDILAAAIIAPARIALRILVGEHRTLRIEHRLGDNILRSDQFDFIALTAKLLLDRGRDLRIDLGEGRGEERIGSGLGTGIG